MQPTQQFGHQSSNFGDTTDSSVTLGSSSSVTATTPFNPPPSEPANRSRDVETFWISVAAGVLLGLGVCVVW